MRISDWSSDVCSSDLVVRKLRPEADDAGEIVDLEGRVLGRHRGLIHFTVGQRRGIDIGGQAEPLYVVRIDAGQRRVVVGPRSALAVAKARLSDINWLAIGQIGRASWRERVCTEG